ncbi:MAG: class I SAM-dependent methyltransferase [Nitrospira sp.]|nr:class I SAM-dependent methyltransferase [Nitrospira sp.]
MRVTACRVCAAAPLADVLDFGTVALANSYLPDAAAAAMEPRYPMALCLCQACGHLQINEEVPPADLFRNYLYVTGTSDAVHQHGRLLNASLSAVLPSGRQAAPFIVEAASNDGTILALFKKAGWRVLGVDPAENIADMANARGVETWPTFFSRQTAGEIVARHGRADVFLGRHVLAHVAGLHDFLDGVRAVLRDDGAAVVECPHVLPMFTELQYDQVYHEHLGFFSVTVLRRLFAMHGLELFAVREVGMHGGSLLAFAQPAGAGRPEEASVSRIMQREAEVGVGTLEAWRGFADRVIRQREALVAELTTLRRQGKRVAAYGAAAKGQVMLQWCGIGPDLVEFIVDKSELKQGRLTPGTHIPILAPQALLDRQPDVVLLCAWNFADEILRQQKAYLDRGGRFLHPIPLPHYL